MTFSTSTASSDPGTGTVRLSTTPQNTSTSIYVDSTDDFGASLNTFLQTISSVTSTIKGHIRISNRTDATKFLLFQITGVADNTGWWSLSVSNVGSSTASPFSNSEDIIISFVTTGDKGAQGNQGDRGFQGWQGDQGARGFQGDQGARGFQGDQGARGFQGWQGDQGARGFQGDQGRQGPQGDQGAQGRQGPQGDQGRQGPQGDQGRQGPQGNQGPQGIQGIQGFQGNQGPQGIQGIQGFQGIQGIQGAQGFQGIQGIQGSVGAFAENTWINNKYFGTNGDIYAVRFYDSNDGTYYVDPSNGTSGYFAGVVRQNDGKYARDSYYRTYSGFSDYYSGGSAGWYRVAQITLTGNCSGAVIYGTLYDHRYDGADTYQISVVARAECDFTSNNESHYINVGCTILGSTNYSDYRSKIRVLLTASSSNSRTYELQFYESPWNHDTWQLETTGWTIYTSPQAANASTGTARVNYVSNQSADYQRANIAMYSPIYYDANDTSYYVDPLSTSRLNALNLTGALQITGARITVSAGGANTYGIFAGYENNNHLITIRGQITGNTSSPSISGAHQTTFVEYAEANDSTGWYFKTSQPGTYTEVARITRSTFNYQGNTVYHSGNLTNLNQLTNGPGYITSYTETDTLASVTGRGASTSTAINMSGGSGTTATLVLDRNIASPSNYYNGLQLEVRATSGTAGIGLHRNGYSHVGIYHDTTNVLNFNMNGGTVTLNHNTGTVWGTGNLTNLNQLTNGPGYITGYTETDTLASVTGRGASTSTAITVNNKIEVSRNGSYAGYVDADLIVGHGGNDRRGYGGTGGSNIMLRSSSKSTITALDESNDLGQISYENLVWTIGENIGWGVQRVDFPGVVNLSSTLRLPNNALVSVNNEPDVWGARFRTTTSTTNLGSQLKNIIWTGGGSNEGFAITGSGTGGASFEVRNDGKTWVRGDLTAQSNMYVLADGSSGYVASRIWLYSHNNYRGAGIYLSGTGSTWFAGTGYTDFDGAYIISRRGVAGDDSTAWNSYRLWQVSSGGSTYQTGDMSASSVHAYAATGKVVAGSWNFDGMLFDSSRSALIARGNYPHVEIWSDVSNSNHGPTLRFGGYDNGSSGAYKSWNIGTAGSNLVFLDIGYGGNNSNPHAGIAGLGAAYSYPGAITLMRFYNDGNVGIGNFGTYGSEGAAPAFKLDVRGTGRFTGALSANTTITVGSGGDALAIAGAEGRITFRDQALTWTGYVGFRGNTGILEFPGRNVSITSGYNGTVTIDTGTNDYLSGKLTVPYGTVNARRGFTSESNPWGTSDSSYHPNGITTAGGTNWVYGHTYLGNAPSNGSGAQVESNGRLYVRSSATSGGAGYASLFIDRSSAANNWTPFSFENEYGNHSWGTVARFHIQNNSGTDRPSIQFSSGFNNTRWSIGYVYPDDNFRITQNHGYRPDGSTNDGWGTERFRINTDGVTNIFNRLNIGSTSGRTVSIGDGTYANHILCDSGVDFAFNYNNSNSGGFGFFGGTSSAKFMCSSGGTLTVSGDVIAYGSPSDARLKDIKEKVPNALNTVLQLNGYRFDWKERELDVYGDDKQILHIKEDIGVIAQEVVEVLPELTRTNEDGFMSVRYQGLTAVLIEAIKEQQAQIETQQQQINELKYLLSQK